MPTNMPQAYGSTRRSSLRQRRARPSRFESSTDLQGENHENATSLRQNPCAARPVSVVQTLIRVCRSSQPTSTGLGTRGIRSNATTSHSSHTLYRKQAIHHLLSTTGTDACRSSWLTARSSAKPFIRRVKIKRWMAGSPAKQIGLWQGKRMLWNQRLLLESKRRHNADIRRS